MSCCGYIGANVIYPMDESELQDDAFGSESALERAAKHIAIEDSTTTILQDRFSIYPKYNVKYDVILTRDDVIINQVHQSNARRRSSSSSSTNQVPNIIPISDVTGCHVMKSRNTNNSLAYFCIYYYPYRKKPLGKKRRQKQTIVFAVDLGGDFVRNKIRALEWKNTIVCLAQKLDLQDIFNNHLPLKPQYLVLVNPCSGTGKSRQIFEQEVEPMFTEAEISYQLVITERANHARDMMYDLPLNDFSGIIIVSGDGLVYEVLNGLMARTDWERAAKMPIGVLPSGSGNALASAICHTTGESLSVNFTQHCTYILLKHVPAPMDLVVVETKTQRMASFLSVTWGIAADVDLESEKLRKLGALRFTLGAVKRILSLKTYDGRLSFLPVEPYVPRARSKSHNDALSRSNSVPDNSKTNHTTDDIHTRNNSRISREERMRKAQSLPEINLKSRSISQIDDDENDQTENKDLEDLPVSTENPVTNFTVSDSTPTRGVLAPTDLLPPLNEPVPSDWVTLEERYIMVTAVYQSHLGRDLVAHLDIKPDDGCITLMLARSGVSKAQLLSIFGAMEDGTHVTNPHLEFIKCKAFRLEPFTPGGVMAVDGERIEYGPLQAQVLPSVARVMAL